MTPGPPEVRDDAPPSTDVIYTDNAPIDTWFGVGGRAACSAEAASLEQLTSCLDRDPGLRILGDGANLLVHDRGVDGLVVSLGGSLRAVHISADGVVVAGGGARLPQVINACVRAGLAGLEGLAGIPASMGGAAVMNAGGAFGSIGEVISRVHVLHRNATTEWRSRDELCFAYRHSTFSGPDTSGPLVLAVEMNLTQDAPEACRERLLACMACKSATQPLREKSAGCCFKNPTLSEAIEGIGDAGQRVSAGLLLDRAGVKGMTVGGAMVSEQHANFIVTDQGANAADIIELMDRAAAHVRTSYGVTLEREVVVWGAP